MSASTPAATDLSEDALVSWLFLRSPVTRDLVQAFDLPSSASVAMQVPTTSIIPTAIGPGDIDVLVAHKESPNMSIAIETKRVKVVPETFHTQMPGKLQGLERGVHQANLLTSLLFHRTMLLVLVVIDGRDREGLNFASRGLTSKLARLIDDFPGKDKLSPSIDIAIAEITQPVDKSIYDAGAVAIRILRRGTTIVQPESLTSAISKHFSFGRSDA